MAKVIVLRDEMPVPERLADAYDALRAGVMPADREAINLLYSPLHFIYMPPLCAPPGTHHAAHDERFWYVPQEGPSIRGRRLLRTVTGSWTSR